VAKKKWLKGAIKHPGALRKKAKAAGAINKMGNIELSWLLAAAKRGDKTGAQARLAMTMRKMKKR